MGCSCPIRWKDTMIFGSSTWSFMMIILGDDHDEEEEKGDNDDGDDDSGDVDDCFSPPEC